MNVVKFLKLDPALEVDGEIRFQNERMKIASYPAMRAAANCRKEFFPPILKLRPQLLARHEWALPRR